MSQETRPETSEGIAARARRGALWLLFAAVLMIPKALSLRRKRSWNAVRLAAALLGLCAILAGFGAIHGNAARIAAIAGGALLGILALTIPPEQTAASPQASSSIDMRARTLGALVVVDGGEYQSDGRAVAAYLFVGPHSVWALDSALEILIEIPTAQISAMRAEREGPPGAGETWKLCVLCEHSTANFIYRGPFGEHLARVAESTIGTQLRRELPVLR